MTVADLDPGLGRAILEAVDAGFDAQLALTAALVRCPSTRGRERTAQDLVADALAGRGYAVDRWRLEPAELAHHPGASPVDVDYAQASNVVGTHEPRAAAGRSLVINGHVDVVPTGPLDMWRHPPFAPVIEDGWMYGRGAADMKSGLVAAIAALDALRATGHQPAARLHLESVVEEESTGNGALACHLRGYRAEAALIPEPMGGHLARANLGVLWFRIEVRGHPVHVSQATTGANAIAAAARLQAALKTLEGRWNERRVGDRWFKDHPHPININVGRIEGGDWASSVPAWCTLHCRAAFYPGTKPADALAEIESAIAEVAAADPFLARNPPRVICNGFHVEGYALEPGSEAEDCLGQAHAAVFERPLETTLTPAYLDARVFALYDRIPCLVYGAVGENSHGFDERVDLESLRRVTGVLALFVARWCGLEPLRR
jgi:acetylornithine deacetylase